jgi:hypothetical protein
MSQQRPIPTNVPSVAEALAAWEQERDLREIAPVAVYVSTPITTGRTFITWWRKDGAHLARDSEAFDVQLRANVILPNLRRTARVLELLRWRHVGVIIDPTSFDVPGWNQEFYNEFWTAVIARHVKRVILLNGWEYSRGCVQEFEAAQQLGIDCVDESFAPLPKDAGLQLIASAVADAHAAGVDVTLISSVYDRMTRDRTPAIGGSSRELYKDEVLDHLARTANVAQFVSFSPAPLKQRYTRIRGIAPNHDFGSVERAVTAILQNSGEGTVNIRSFDPRRPEGNPFIKRLTSVPDVVASLRKLAATGLYTIVNEAIDESDGGVSGVAYRGAVEFAPDATPRCVDDVDVDTATMPFEVGLAVLRTVYGFDPDLRGREGARVEFSIHPSARGWRSQHTVLWQLEQRPAPDLRVESRWPHRFSRLLGDKAFGLAIASATGLPVPRTIVFSRRLFPFVFGEPTGSGTTWTRTCPETKAPGYYPSAPYWRDPVAVLDDPWLLMKEGETPDYHSVPSPAPRLASVLIQEGVAPAYSGRATSGDAVRIEGVSGPGDAFMLGDSGPEKLPNDVERCVRALCERAAQTFGGHQLEWVYDGARAWVVQLNVAQASITSTPDEGISWTRFAFHKGALEGFRKRVLELQGKNVGIIVVGNVSALSHAGEIAQQYGVPAKFVGPTRAG